MAMFVQVIEWIINVIMKLQASEQSLTLFNYAEK